MTNKLAHAAVLAAQLFFSGWHILGKLALNSGINPIIFACYREILASILMVGTAYFSTRGEQKEPRLKKPAREDWLRFAYLGFASFSNVVGFIVGLKLTSAASAASLQPSIPIFAMVLAALLRTERLTLWKGFGILLGVGGAVLVVVFGDAGGSDSTNSSTTMILGHGVLIYQCMMMSSMVVIQKAIVHKYYATWFTFWYYVIGTGLTCALVMYWIPQGADVWVFPGWKAWAALAYVSFFATLVCYVIYTWANNHLPSTTVLLYSTVQSVATSILSYIFLGSSIMPLQIVGSALVISGLFVTVYSQQRDAKLALAAIGKDKRSGTTDSYNTSYGYSPVMDAHHHDTNHPMNGNNGNHSNGSSGQSHHRVGVRSIGGGGFGVHEFDASLMAGIDVPGGVSISSPMGNTTHTSSSSPASKLHGSPAGNSVNSFAPVSASSSSSSSSSSRIGGSPRVMNGGSHNDIHQPLISSRYPNDAPMD